MNTLSCNGLSTKEFRYNICRICLCSVTSSNAVNIFDAKPFYLKKSLLEIFMDVAPVEVEVHKYDALPTNLCLKCAVRLKNYAIFRGQIKDADHHLRLKLRTRIAEVTSSKDMIVVEKDFILVRIDETDDDVLNQNIESFCTTSKQKSKDKQELAPSKIKLETVVDDDVICIDDVNDGIGNLSKIVKNTPDISVNTNKSYLDLFQVNHVNSNSKITRTTLNKPVVDVTDIGFGSVDARQNVQCKENSKAMFSNSNSTFGQSDSVLIKELLNSHMSNSIIVTNESSDVNNQSSERLISTNISSDISKERLPFQSSPTTIIEKPVNHNECSKCGQTFSSVVFLQRHLEYHDLNVLQLERSRSPFRNPANDKTQPSSILRKTLQDEPSNILQNIKDSPSSAEKQMACCHCKEMFPEEQLSWHIYLKHKNENNVPLVEVQNPLVNGLARCNHCQQMFPATQLSSHIYLKHNREHILLTDMQKCKYCIAELEPSQMRIHIKTIHREEHERSKRERYPCSACNKKFKSKHQLQRHFNTNHELKFHCTHCNQSFVKHTALNFHLKDHHKIKITTQSLCYICGKLVSSAFLSAHYQTHVKKSIKCTVEGCNAVLKYKYSLRDHHYRIHGAGVPSFICEQCGKGFALRGSLKHHQVAHMDPHQFKHVCHICERRYYTSKSLKGHLKVHVREKVFTCPECSMVFAYEPFMVKHRKKVHLIV